VGLIAGFTGEALLVGTAASHGDVPLDGMLVVVGASLAWAVGSLYARNAPLPRNPLLGSGMQQLAGAGVILAVAVVTGQFGGFDVSEVTRSSWLGLLWLILAGSFVGFSVYLWLLRNVRTSLVGTYAYVNPIVAVFLGAVVLHEQLPLRVLVAAAIVLSSVALIVSAGGTARVDSGREQRRAELQPEVGFEG
jgi:drug/metabolite transporter (DMT)-like permease